ncbi:unnamed protein product, partial [Mesorhabditis belari]|uniref:Lon protease homolog n=1 Tax=Mesorhabditis belari TaxID=2138241 RepID=A0AAF3EB33_9BILA
MELPVLLLSNGVLMPEAKMRIPVRSKFNLEMLDRFVVNRGMAQGKTMILIAYREDKDVYPYATVASVEQVTCWQYNAHTQYTLHVVGVSRAKIEAFKHPTCTVKFLVDIHGDVSSEIETAFLENCNRMLVYLSRENTEAAYRLQKLLKEKRLDSLSDAVMSHLNAIPNSTLLTFLSTVDVPKRVDQANAELDKMFKNIPLAGVQIEDLIPVKGTRRITPGNRTHLGQKRSEEDELERKLDEAQLPDTVKERVLQDYEKLKKMGTNSQESHVLRSYLELVASLPWNKSTTDQIDISIARKALEDSHEGMKSVKTRVLEFLAVRKLSDAVGGPILCFSGPPGIGKTSVARAIATALGRKFERISLGGIRDESDIRGHRRTYVGAMHGRIIQAIRHAGSKNPLILLDEVDKLYAGVSGSPSAALLEVLDPEQNFSFVDHYLNLPFDLSNVLFIATANDTSNIEPPLLDRMELIEMTGYSTHEKLRIVENHIIPRQLPRHGLSDDCIEFEMAGLQHIVNGYTKEAGVRQLERCVAALCRHAALRVAEVMNGDCTADTFSDLELPVIVDIALVEKVLGIPKFSHFDLVTQMKAFRPGVCFGLAWTPFGGELMLIETSGVKGKGEVSMTGKLGDVLKESVSVARSWLRANVERYKLEFSEEMDIHVHLPAGAIGKDGPSAGCALVLALFSLVAGRNVRNDTAVTGEISLSGSVLPVGGIKEKVIGAHRAGLRRVTLPASNRNHFEEIEDGVRREIDVVFVETIDELLTAMMEPHSLGYLAKL